MNQPEPPRQRIGVVRFLLIAVVVVVVSSLGMAYMICSGANGLGRASLERKTVGLASTALVLIAPRWIFGRAADGLRSRPYHLLAGIAAAAATLTWWLS